MPDTDTQHTPPPWEVLTNQVIREDPLRPDDYWIIATLSSTAPRFPNNEGHKPEDLGQNKATLEANARLIAAAPDLLQAAKSARDQLRHVNDYAVPEGVMEVLNDAIAKAEGNG